MTSSEKRLYHWLNIAMRIILYSPIHRVLSNTTLVVSFTGRTSGKQYYVPISYITSPDSLTCFTNRTWSVWWKNLQGSVPVTVRVKGRTYTGIAMATHGGGSETTHYLATFLRKFPATAKRYDVRLDENGQPDHQDVVQAVENPNTIMITIRCSEYPTCSSA